MELGVVVYAWVMLAFICMQKYHVKAQYIGQDCSGTMEHICDDIENANCDMFDHVCECDHSYYGAKFDKQCQRVHLGDDCSGPKLDICNRIKYAECPAGICQCPEGFYGIPETTVCSKALVGALCTMGFAPTCDLIPNLECPDSSILTARCTCSKHYYGSMWTTECERVKLGDDCTGDDKMAVCKQIDGAECTAEHICTCTSGLFGDAGTTTCSTDDVAEATVRCSKTTDEMLIEIRAEKDDNHQQLATFTATTDLTTSTCKAKAVTTAKPFLELSFRVSIDTRKQTDPDLADGDCLIQIDPDDSNKMYVLVMGQADVNYIQATDMYYKAVCDMSTANGEVVALENVGIISAIDPTTKESEEDKVALSLVKAADNTDLGTTDISLTEEVKLKVTLTRKAFVTAPLGVFLHDVHVSDQADVTTAINKVKILDEYGCVVDNPVFKPETTFVPGNPNVMADSAVTFEALTGKFNLALFEGITELKLFFSVEYEASCFVNTDIKCFDLQAYCKENTPASRRRRRSATGVKNGTVTLGVTLNLGGHSTANQGDAGNDLNNIQQCQTSGYFWIIAVVLGCLALAALLFAFFLFRRLKLEQRRSDKLDEKLGVRNPAF